MDEQRRRRQISPPQLAFLQSDARFRGFVGGRGSGKTWCGAYDLLTRCRFGRTYLISSPTSIIMGDTTFPTVKRLAQEMDLWDPAALKMTPYPTVILLNGATLRFRTAEDPEKMRGPNLSGVWLDEASLMHKDAYLICIAA